MSAESELRAALVAHAPLLAVVPAARISIDAVDPLTPRPFIAFSKSARVDENGLDGTVLGVLSTIDLQCVGSDRANAIVVADLVRDALRAADNPSDGGSAGYDPENGFEVEVVTVEWAAV